MSFFKTKESYMMDRNIWRYNQNKEFIDVSKDYHVTILQEYVDHIKSCKLLLQLYSRFVDSEFFKAYKKEFGKYSFIGNEIKLGDTIYWCYTRGKKMEKFLFIEREIKDVVNVLHEFGGTPLSFVNNRYDRITHEMTMTLMLWGGYGVSNGNNCEDFIKKQFKVLNKKLKDYKSCTIIFT